MKLPKLQKLNIQVKLRKFTRALHKNLPTILSIGGCLGVPVTAYLSGRAAIKAKEVLDQQPDDSSFHDDFKAIAKYFIAPTITGLATMGSIVGANHMHLKRNAALSAAGAALAEYVITLRQKAEEQFGEEGLQKIDNEIIKQKYGDKLKDYPRELEDDEFFVYEPYSETLFVTTERKLNDAERILNYDFNRLMSVNINEFLILASGEPSDSPYAEYIGWDKDNEVQEELWYGWQGFDWIGWTINDADQEIGVVPTIIWNVEPLPTRVHCKEKEVIEVYGNDIEEACYPY